MGVVEDVGGAKNISVKTIGTYPKAKEIYSASEANELFFGVVGHVGSGTGFIGRMLKDILAQRGYAAEVIRASKAIKRWARRTGKSEVPPDDNAKSIERTERLQTLGDEMRSSTDDYAAVAQGVIDLIREQRAEWTETTAVKGQPVQPDKKKRAYIINSIRHPAEVNTFRLLYGDAFCLVGVVCHEDIREERLMKKYQFVSEIGKKIKAQPVIDLMRRDADDKGNKSGQHVADAFWESDFFFDNTADISSSEEFTANEELGRLVDVISHSRVVRPTMAETGMHIAVSSQIRSACMSRQVGASIVDREGNILAIGTNEVPKAGGGVYGEGFDDLAEDDRRCVACCDPHCSSNLEQNMIIRRLLEEFPSLRSADNESDIVETMRRLGLGSILEFTRVIHAEMDALTTAARRGVSVKGATMFVTTFPCHYCARHVVAAGIDQVQYIEPYPKSRALSLHGDSITSRTAGWIAPSAVSSLGDNRGAKQTKDKLAFKTVGNEKFGLDSNVGKVLFRPFTGVAPRLYQRAFTKDRKLKDDITGAHTIGVPEWGGRWGIRMVPYTELEARLTSEGADEAN